MPKMVCFTSSRPSARAGSASPRERAMAQKPLMITRMSLTSEPICEDQFATVMFLGLGPVEGLAQRQQGAELHTPGAEQPQHRRSGEELAAAAVGHRGADDLIVPAALAHRFHEQAPVGGGIVVLEIRRPPAPHRRHVVEVAEPGALVGEVMLGAAAYPPIAGARGVAGD